MPEPFKFQKAKIKKNKKKNVVMPEPLKTQGKK